MEHPKVRRFEKKLKRILDEIDDVLEEKYGSMYSLHPARPKRGTTSNKEQNGLFNIGAAFTPGFGSQFGRGYVIDVDIVTLEQVPENQKETINKEIENLLQNKLDKDFPHRELKLVRDGNLIKMKGNLSLGSV